MSQSMILSFFGGVSQDGSSWMADFDRVLYELARWLLPIGICLLAEGVWLETWRKVELLACYRYVTVRKWWRQKFARVLLWGVWMGAALFLVAMAADLLTARGFAAEGWKVFLLWLAHIITIMIFFLVLDMAGLGRGAPAILLLLEGGTFLMGFSNIRIAGGMYGMWGMYFQSEWYFGETGISVPASLITELALVVFSYLAGGILLARKAGMNGTCQ
ncbi:MAG: hypothetical protein HFI42_09285 [Lachnospiraceae bacterium]|nr:hypothetical protein [Lachnospiraceae bacterium]